MKKNNILRYLGDYRKECVLSPIFKFLESAMELFVPLVVAKIIDQGIPNKDDGFIWSASGILLLFAHSFLQPKPLLASVQKLDVNFSSKFNHSLTQL